MVVTCILAQIVDNFKDLLTVKDVQKIPSVKFYSKIILYGSSCLSLSIISAISQTLNYELDILSQLSVEERFYFLATLKKSFIFNQVSFQTLNNFSLEKIRYKLSLQFRSSLLSTTFVYPNSLVLGLPINLVTLETILDSSKIIWISLGLLEEDFNFMLLKDSFVLFNLNNNNLLKSNLIESIRFLCRLEFSKIIKFDDFLLFDRDFSVFNSYDNLLRG